MTDSGQKLTFAVH